MQNLASNSRMMPIIAAHPWSVEAAIDVPGAHIELRRYELPRPSEMWELDDAPILSSVLPRPEGTHGEVRFVGGDPCPARVGSLLLRPAGVRMHSVGDGGGLNILTCRFDRELFNDVTGLRDWDRTRLRRCASLQSRSVAEAIERVRKELITPAFASAMAIEGSVKLLLVEIARVFQPRAIMQRPSGGLARWQLLRIQECLTATEGNWPTTQEIAAQCGISRSHLSRAFATSTGNTLAEYAATLRIERAKSLMRDAELSMQQIAQRLGFGTASGFAVAFRRATGYTPLHFAGAVRGDRGAPPSE